MEIDKDVWARNFVCCKTQKTFSDFISGADALKAMAKILNTDRFQSQPLSKKHVEASGFTWLQSQPGVVIKIRVNVRLSCDYHHTTDMHIWYRGRATFLTLAVESSIQLHTVTALHSDK